jgi:type IV pilus biogenesis protein CpaD/CtpE
MKSCNTAVCVQLTVILAVALTGCASNDQSATKKEFGSSVRHMISSQMYEPGDEVSSLDGDKSRKVIQTYREDISKPKEVEQQIINIKFD